MRSIKVLFTVSVGTLAAALCACATSGGTNTNGGDAASSGSSAGGGTGSSNGTGSGNGTGNGSGASSSGAGIGNGASSSGAGNGNGASGSGAGNGNGSGSSSGGGGAGSSSNGGGDDAAGDDGGDSTGLEGNCPDTCAGASESCCLVNMAGTVWGICATQAACTAQGGGFLACGSPDDCGGAASATPACCLMGAGAGAVPTTICMASCPAGLSPACNVDGTTCPNGGAGFDCSPVSPSIPVDAIGTCTPSAAGGGDDSGAE
jgi:hypothetical protein